MNALEAKRKEMIDAGMELGLCHPETVRLSQELDVLLNELEVKSYIGGMKNVS